MRLRLLKSKTRHYLLALLLLLLWQRAQAQRLPADDFFHGGALFYLSNNIAGAWERVTNGLAIYPDDLKLKKLEELLKQQQQQQQKQQQNDKSKADQQKDQKPDQSGQKQQEQQKKDSRDKKDQPQPEKQSDDQEKPKPDEEQRAEATGQMTPQQAKRLLDAEKNDEALLPVKLESKTPPQRGPIKDW